MGLIRAAIDSVTGVIADTWRDYFYCDSLPPEVLMTKGHHRTSESRGNKGSDNVISNGSIIAVNQGQCAMIVDQGLIVEFVAEPGAFVWDSSSEPSLFYGPFGDNLRATWEQLKKRWSMGGDPGTTQRVYFFNTKEITDNKYGTANPVPFRVVVPQIGLDLDTSIRVNGTYSYRIVDPMIFYSQVAGNVAEEYNREQIDGQLKGELLNALQPALAKVSALGIRYYELPAHTTELAAALNEVLSQQWRAMRGLEVASFNIMSATLPPDDEKRIKDLQSAAVMRDPNMGAAAVIAAQADAMRIAAGNEAGATAGFIGMGLAQQSGGANPAALYQLGQQAPAQPGQPVAQGVPAAPVPAPAQAAGWTCGCGQVNAGKFCANCGQPAPSGAAAYRCNKCGWTPADPAQPPKFCPDCGDPFDASDRVA